MKKLILAMGLLAISTSSSYAYMHKTSCGVMVQTIPSEYFETEQEWLDYCAELDDIYC